MLLRLALALAIVSLLVAAGCGSSSSSDSGKTSSSSSSAKASNATVDLHKTDVGDVLTGPSGRTLYLFEKDKSPKSTCSGECANDWPPLMASGKPAAGSGVKASMLGTSMRSDGKEQVTYNGHPLYYFEGDKKAGQTAGQGVDAFGAEWYVVGANGSKVEGGEDQDSGKDSSGDSSNTPSPY
jgi:predicted lipoprotein with Yx(FWY)xxD motif